MQVKLSAHPPLEFTGDLLVIGRAQGAGPGALEAVLHETLKGALSAKAERARFTGAAGQSVTIDTLGLLPCARLKLIGLGKAEAWGGALGGLAVRDAVAAITRAAQGERAASVCVALPLSGASAYEAALGARLGVYQFNTCKTADPESPTHEITSVELAHAPLSADEGEPDASGLARAEITAEAVTLARNLVNEPPNVCTPERLAGVARDLAAFEGVGVKVLGRAEIEALGMGGLTAVSQGATREPKFIHVHYRPTLAEGASPKGSLALIGKGLTFDSGGLSLKPPKSQEDMHIDMGGAAAVLGAMWALVRLRPEVELHGIVGACENMPDGNSFRPSDILTMYNKKTVEVLNTDAEGRLVLADALHYAAELKPDAMVNLATLTGACMVGLGTNYCGLFSDDDAFAAELLKAADASHEKLWRLPLDEGLADTLKSKRADITNLGGPYGGAITAALFLKHFKGDRRWAHLDIAGPTTASKDKGATSAGATGFGVLTLIELASAFEA